MFRKIYQGRKQLALLTIKYFIGGDFRMKICGREEDFSVKRLPRFSK